MEQQMNEESCHRHTLAQGPLCRVDVCGCGMLHVSIGPFTVRLEPRACEEIVETLARALGHLATRSGQPREARRWQVEAETIPKPKAVS
jgi:hypothetical protein